jgi:hypothetical protein
VFSYYYRLASAKNDTAASQYVAAFSDYFAMQAEQKKYLDLNHRMQLVQYQLYTKPRWTEEEQRQLMGEISSLHMQFEKFLREANNVSVSITCPQTGSSLSFRESILNEPVATISSVTFDFERLREFINQLTNVVNKVAKLNNDCFKKILAIQTSLSPATEEKMIKQLAG